MRCQKTLTCGQHGAASVALNRSALQYKAVKVGVSAFYDTVVVQTAVYGVVKGGFKLVAPSVKAEVEQRVGAVAAKCYESVVACPCVVCRTFMEYYIVQLTACQSLAEFLYHRFRLRGNHEQLLISCYGVSHFGVCCAYIVKILTPVGAFVRPCQLYGALICPFGQQYGIVVHTSCFGFVYVMQNVCMSFLIALQK